MIGARTVCALLASIAVMCFTLPSTAAAGQKALRVLDGAEPASKQLELGEGFELRTTQSSTLVTPGGVVECANDESGPSEVLVEEGVTREVFSLNSESSIGGYPCPSTMDLGEGNLIIAPVELALNASGRVDAPGLQVAANFSAGASCHYVGAHAKGKMPIGSTPVELSIHFANVGLKLGGALESSPICPRTARLFTTLWQPGPQPVYVQRVPQVPPT